MVETRPLARRAAAALLALAAATACERGALPAAAPPAPLAYDGATSISDRILPDALPLFRARTGIDVHVYRSGTGKGLEAVLEGRASVAGVSRALTPAELSRHPYFQIFAYDALAVYVNAANPVRSLTRAQLRAIFTGQATAWRALGGPAEPVIGCIEHPDSRRATVDAFRALALDGAPYARGLREAEDPSDCLRVVAATPGGITPASMAYAVAGTRAVPVDGLVPSPQNVRSGAYALTRPLLLVAREPPTGELKQFFDFMLSPDAQAVVARSGFVPAR